MTNTEKTLYYLDELPDYKVASDDCDVRGWMVADNTGRTVGLVDSLLVNKDAERVVYLGVEVSKEVMVQGNAENRVFTGEGMTAFLNSDGDTHLMVPVALVEVDKEAERVLMPKVNFKTFVRRSVCQGKARWQRLRVPDSSPFFMRNGCGRTFRR